jgi:hypothetical protein
LLISKSVSPMAFLDEATPLITMLESSGHRGGRGANTLRSADPARARWSELERELGARARELAELYERCDGLSLPDVGGGCFLHPIAAILNGIKNGEPTKIAGEEPGNVVVFGSDGRGGRLALRIASGEILYLAPGVVRVGVYESTIAPRVLAASAEELFDRLIDDLRAAVAGDTKHSYLM